MINRVFNQRLQHDFQHIPLVQRGININRIPHDAAVPHRLNLQIVCNVLFLALDRDVIRAAAERDAQKAGERHRHLDDLAVAALFGQPDNGFQRIVHEMRRDLRLQRPQFSFFDGLFLLDPLMNERTQLLRHCIEIACQQMQLVDLGRRDALGQLTGGNAVGKLLQLPQRRADRTFQIVRCPNSQPDHHADQRNECKRCRTQSVLNAGVETAHAGDLILDIAVKHAARQMADAVNLAVQRFVAADCGTGVHLRFQLINVAVDRADGAQRRVEVLCLVLSGTVQHIVQFPQSTVDQHPLPSILEGNTAGNHVPHLIRQVLHQHSADLGGTGRQCNIRAIALCQHNQQTCQHAHR